MLNPSIQGTDKQDKSQLIQRNDTLTIFPYIKSTKNYPTMCGAINKKPHECGALLIILVSQIKMKSTWVYLFHYHTNLLWQAS